MKSLDNVTSKYTKIGNFDKNRLGLTVDKVFEILPKVFRFTPDVTVNRAVSEKKTLVDPAGHSTGAYHLTPGIYEIVFKGFLDIAPGETAKIAAAPELIRNGLFIVSPNYYSGHIGNLKGVLHVNGAGFEFNDSSIIAHLSFVGNETENKLNLIPITINNNPKEPILHKGYTENGIDVHDKNPFISEIKRLEEISKNLPSEPVVTAVQKPKRNTGVLGKKWAYLEVDGEITHKLRIAEDQIESYISKGYTIAFPPNMKDKNKPQLLLENTGE